MTERHADTRFDAVARALAEPMPRRRAVRVVGVFLSAAVIPGWLARPVRASGSRASACSPQNEIECGDNCCDRFAACFPGVALKDGTLGLCCPKLSGNPVPCSSSSDPAGAWCCPPGSKCCPGTPAKCCAGCPPKRKPCFDVCCPPGEVCDRKKRRCKCAPGTRLCGKKCCPTTRQSVCLPPSNTCCRRDRVCRGIPDAGGRIDSCCKSNERCDIDQGKCVRCPKGLVACGSDCCKPGWICPPGYKTCVCPPNRPRCGEECCKPGKFCDYSNDPPACRSCPSGQRPCGRQCCSSGEVCKKLSDNSALWFCA